MKSLQISSGVIRLDILDDSGESRGIFKFNPNDIETAKAMLEMQKDLDIKFAEYEARQADTNTDLDNAELILEIVNYFEDIIDKVFGSGTSELLFGDSKTIEMLECFFDGITPYFEEASKKRIAKYSDNTKPTTKRKSTKK